MDQENNRMAASAEGRQWFQGLSAQAGERSPDEFDAEPHIPAWASCKLVQEIPGADKTNCSPC